VPRLWTATIEQHRRAVRDATIDATAALVTEHGLNAVTMSGIAEKTGIGRATLYKYFPDVEAILLAWHERQITTHLAHLAEARDHARTPGERLPAVLRAYAVLAHQRPDPDLTALLHRGEHAARARRHLHDLLGDLLTDGVRAGCIRSDVPVEELAGYCVHALAAAGELRSTAAVRRLVSVTLAGLRPSPPRDHPPLSSDPMAGGVPIGGTQGEVSPA
jgi:AcrR family transcriptional regulator